LLQQLIATPSFSKQEAATAILIEQWLQQNHIQTKRVGNNVYAINQHFDAAKPSILLNSHHDTVKPNGGYTLDPFQPILKDERIYGLGSNDAGGCLVSLMACFVHFYSKENLPYNIVLLASAEEEISGTGGVELALADETFLQITHQHFKQSAAKENCFAIVGEPTLMQMAVAERGLMVVDAVAIGKAGHAARQEGINALYLALQDIESLRQLKFDQISELTGETRLSVTVIDTPNKQHNVVPDTCNFVIDVRVNENYTFPEVIKMMESVSRSSLTPRSMRLRATGIDLAHPIVQSGIQLGLTYYGSPTTSDKALMQFPALKMGPGFSGRSHTADEYLELKELEDGIAGYIQLLNQLFQSI
jgi:acetylornithine deacetylase